MEMPQRKERILSYVISYSKSYSNRENISVTWGRIMEAP